MTLKRGIVGECSTVVQDIVTDQAHARHEQAATDVGRIAAENFRQECERFARDGVIRPDHIVDANRLTHVQIASFGDAEHWTGRCKECNCADSRHQRLSRWLRECVSVERLTYRAVSAA